MFRCMRRSVNFSNARHWRALPAGPGAVGSAVPQLLSQACRDAGLCALDSRWSSHGGRRGQSSAFASRTVGPSGRRRAHRRWTARQRRITALRTAASSTRNPNPNQRFRRRQGSRWGILSDLPSTARSYRCYARICPGHSSRRPEITSSHHVGWPSTSRTSNRKRHRSAVPVSRLFPARTFANPPH